MSNSGAQAALQGYRLQALYILSEALSASDPSVHLLPEGKEDLDIRKAEKLERSIQIKAHSSNLRYSDFNPSMPDSFFRRALNTLQGTTAKIEIVTFGPVGPELRKAWDKNGAERKKLWEKFKQDGYTKTEFNSLIRLVDWKPVSEEDLTQQVFTILRNSMTSGSPEVAFDWLMYWIFNASENSKSFAPAEVIRRVEQIGQYIEQRAAHHEEWFTSISPLMAGCSDHADKEQLASEFYAGASANFQHIECGFDVVRHDKLERIADAYGRNKRVVLIHGASGQGKSTLAYRFFHDYLPDNWRFEVKYVEGKHHAARIARAVEAHHSLFEAPIYIFLDVRPGDSEWPELVCRLLDQPLVRILVAIRQDDLVRTAVGSHELGFPETLELEFNRREAELLFHELVANKELRSFPSFEEAWAQFGGNGPLMEFAFLLTQSETLRERLKCQVNCLREEVRQKTLSKTELHLLRVCAVATAYEARIDVARLAKHIDLPDLLASLRRFDREYLIRLSSDKREIVCLHALRSEVLVNELCDDQLQPWGESAKVALLVMDEDSLESFLMYAFSRHPQHADDLVQHIKSNSPSTWTGICGVGRSILWLGIRRYVDENSDVIKAAQAELPKGWFMILRFDLARIGSGVEESILGFMDENHAMMNKIRELRDQQTSKDNAYVQFREWLEPSRLPAHPENARDWNSLSEVLFWLSHLGVENDGMLQSLKTMSFSWPIENLDRFDLAKLNFAIHLHKAHAKPEKCTELNSRALEAFRNFYFVFNIDLEDNKVRADYIVTPEMLAVETDPTASKRGKDFANCSNEMLDYLRFLFPESEAYGTQGYGHNTRLIELGYDPTTKKGVLPKDLPLPWLSEVNQTFLNLVEWPTRPETWTEYGRNALQARRDIGTAFTKLARGLVHHFKSPHAVNLIKKSGAEYLDKALNSLEAFPLLPKQVVDEWGRISETKNSMTTEDTGRQPTPLANASLVAKHKKLLKEVGSYMSSCENFLRQSIQVSTKNLLETYGTDGNKTLAPLVNSVGPENISHLSAINLSSAKTNLPAAQTSYRETLGVVHDIKTLNAQDSSEQVIFTRLCPLWLQYAYNSKEVMDYADSRSVTAYEEFQQGLKNDISSLGKNGSGVSFVVINAGMLYENKTALWISVNATEMFIEGQEIDFINDEFCGLFKNVQYDSYEFHALSMTYEYIVFVLNCNGYVHSNDAICIPLNLFIGSSSGDRINPLLYGRKLSDEQLNSMWLNKVSFPSLKFADELTQYLLRLVVLATFLADFRNAPPEVDEEGARLFKQFIKDKEEDLQEIISGIGSYVETSNIVSYCEKMNNYELNEVLSFLMKSLEDLMPESDENDVFTLDVDGIFEWSQVVYEKGLIVEMSKWYFLIAELGL